MDYALLVDNGENILNVRLEIAKNLLNKRMCPEYVADVTRLSIDRVRKLQLDDWLLVRYEDKIIEARKRAKDMEQKITLNMASKLLTKGIPVEDVADVTELSIDTVRGLQLQYETVK